MFGLRYGEIAVAESSEACTPWFLGVAWDLTEVVFDCRLRKTLDFCHDRHRLRESHLAAKPA
jgi:hypothetical protein